MRIAKIFVLLFTFLLTVGLEATAGETIRRQHEHVLGTSLELEFTIADRTNPADRTELADRVEAICLDEIERLSAILSRYDATSEFMQWQADSARAISPELSAVLTRAEHWREQTAGAFDIRAGVASELWQKAAESQTLPTDAARHAVLEQLAASPYQTRQNDQQHSFVRNDSVALSLDALAKGYILDAVCLKVRQEMGEGNVLQSFSVNIGGDVRRFGDQPQTISIANPYAAFEGAAPLTSFEIAGNVAVATSGNYRRFVEIAGRRFSHVIDPRTLLPCGEVVSSTVVAPSGMDADALATACSVLAPAESLALIDSLKDCECLLVTADKKILTSAGWQKRFAPQAAFTVLAEEKAQTGLHVNFTLNRSRGGRYRRPYVAVWLEDKDGFPVKTAVLWMQTDSPGPRWHRDLTRWYRNDRTRKSVENTDLIGTISGATRGPGDYETWFDGTDNAGKPLASGEYTLCLEVAREKGTYQIVRAPVTWGDKAIAKTELKENVELSGMSFEFIPGDSDN